MADRYERYDRDDRDRGYQRDERGMVDRMGDEVRSWFGDDEAARRRARDEREGYRGEREGYRGEQERNYGGQYGPGSGEGRGWSDRPSGERDRGYEGRSGGGGRDWAAGSSANRSYQGGDSRSYASESRQFGDTSRYSGSDYGRGDDARSYRSSGYGGEGFGRFDNARGRDAGWQGSGRDQARAFWSPRGMGGGYVGPTGGWSEARNWSESRGWGGEDRDLNEGRGWSEGRSGMQGRGSERGSEGRGFMGRGPKGYQRSDERIREDVCDRLADDPHIDASDIEISVSGGEVTLSGFVREREDKRHAEDVVERISGVREVHNSLRLNRGQGHPGDVLGLGPTSQGGEVRAQSGGSSQAGSTGTTQGTTSGKR